MKRAEQNQVSMGATGFVPSGWSCWLKHSCICCSYIALDNVANAIVVGVKLKITPNETDSFLVATTNDIFHRSTSRCIVPFMLIPVSHNGSSLRSVTGTYSIATYC